MVATVRFGVVVTVWLAVVFAGRALAQGSGCVDTLTYNLKESSDLKFFSSAVSETGLDLNLQGPGPYLVFAPSDASFEALQSGDSEARSALLNMDLRQVIEYHIVPTEGYDDFASAPAGTSIDVRTLCENDCGELSISSESGEIVVGDNARVLDTIESCNGLIVIIQGILIPGRGASMPDTTPPEPVQCSPQDPSCCDLPPPEFSCSQQKLWGKCEEPWMQIGNGNGGFCAYTCGRCGNDGYAQPPTELPQERYEYEYEYSNEVEYAREPVNEPITDPRIACQCSSNGMSGNVDTGRVGCVTFEVNPAAEYAESIGETFGERAGGFVSRIFGEENGSLVTNYIGNLWGRVAGAWARDTFGSSALDICYVMDPHNCPVAAESTIFPGAAWRSC